MAAVGVTQRVNFTYLVHNRLTGGRCPTSLTAMQRPGDGPHGVVKAQQRGSGDEAGYRRHNKHEPRPVRDARQPPLAVRRYSV